MSDKTVTPIVQFGTSRFLQAHADLFLSQARDAGQDVGPVTIVQTTGSGARSGRLGAFNGTPIPIVVRGLENGRPIERTDHLTIIVRGLSAASQWDEVERIVVEEAETLISNTSDAGFALVPGEKLGDGVPQSFPLKLLKLLVARWRAGRPPLTLFPCELIPRNGDVLRGILSGQATANGLPPEFHDFLAACIFASSLVDRIVSEPIEPAGAVAEPYALWAIEKQPGLVPPCEHPSVRMVDDLAVVERLKLFILNLGHTVLAEHWKATGRPEGELVREIMADRAMRSILDTLYDDEVLPIFRAGGVDEAPAYRLSVIERFENPFLAHRLAEIFGNHVEKKKRRIGGLLAWKAIVAPDLPTPRLDALLASPIGA
ncbi:mannitol dehydrogenase family protein [Kaistia dalseonensis]|uniref:Tagaturonate reductase n=1 Tax=Kaistia dalseonensis TaxID=410840 RepID=A0ABU0H5T2_9HYPH|nr:mannitol dehydrogenase family protein [Kaistia dalseonensis]MCX5495082.1 mannitol dehydrogenase family protein [Kaistia dalseonensis]MDQ0437664.1 tagaturonate reductase [Kaistia dalseonensis]